MHKPRLSHTIALLCSKVFRLWESVQILFAYRADCLSFFQKMVGKALLWI